MGKKYIVEIGRLERLYKAFVNGNGKPNLTWLSPEVDLTPYTEPDMEQVRKEAYDKGYENGFIAGHLKAEKSGQSFYEDGHQRGLADAWEAARKIGSNSMCSLKEMGFDFSQCAVSDYNPSWFVVKNYSASEAIEKIRQYEQEKEEQIQVGDEVIYDGRRCVVIMPETTKRYGSVMDAEGRRHGFENKEVEKTGRHFPEIAEVFAKMKEKE